MKLTMRRGLAHWDWWWLLAGRGGPCLLQDGYQERTVLKGASHFTILGRQSFQPQSCFRCGRIFTSRSRICRCFCVFGGHFFRFCDAKIKLQIVVHFFQKLSFVLLYLLAVLARTPYRLDSTLWVGNSGWWGKSNGANTTQS